MYKRKYFPLISGKKMKLLQRKIMKGIKKKPLKNPFILVHSASFKCDMWAFTKKQISAHSQYALIKYSKKILCL